MEIIPFSPEYLKPASELFFLQYQKTLNEIPILPEYYRFPGPIAEILGEFTQSNPGLVALQNGRMVGYMTWLIADQFRGAKQRGAYVPVWAHSAMEACGPQVEQVLYQKASIQWAQSQCGVFAITLLANDKAAAENWFWNGFGITVVDAIRPIKPFGFAAPEPFTIRKANLNDLDTLVRLDAEHWNHYSQPPIFMPAHSSHTREELADFIKHKLNSIFVAATPIELVGFMMFENSSEGASELVQSPTTIAITGAYLHPSQRGQGLAAAILNKGLEYYSGLGFERCSVDFESINPEARHLWLKYFSPVCLSVMRHPEA